MEWVAVGAMAIGAAVQGYASYEQGKEERRQANFQAGEARKQADLEQERANIAQLQGEQEAEKRMRAYALEVGSIYANAAGNGMLIDSGSAGDTLGKILDTSSKSAAHDVSTIRDNTKLTIWTHLENKDQLLRSAENYRASGKSAYKAGILGATAAGIQGVGMATGMAYQTGLLGSGSAGASNPNWKPVSKGPSLNQRILAGY